MQFAVQDDRTFSLCHRYVEPRFRRAAERFGTSLWETARAWFQQVAEKTQEPVVILLDAGQPSLWKWATKNGFMLSQESKSLFEEVTQHPERFIEDAVILSPESQHLGIQKDQYLFRRTTKDRYMERAVRVQFEYTVHPPSTTK
jgi:hypothetical protein